MKSEAGYKGTLNVRLGEETHRRAAIYALTHNQSLDSFIDFAVQEKLAAYGKNEDKT